GSTILTLDQDQDGDHDLYLGDFSTRNLLFIPNVGNANSASLDVTAQMVNSPVGTTPVDIRFCPAAYYLDLNNSGVKDMVVAPNQRSEILSDTSQTTQNVWYYENEGQDNNPDFAFKSATFLINEMIDVGSYSNPVLADVDGDSLADLLVGNDRVTDNNNDNYGTIAYYRNTGTKYVPEFELVTSDLASISTLEIRNVYPAIGDLNNDGKPDMIVGDGSGFLHYYRNTTTDSIASFALEKVKYMDIDVSFNATPQLVDIDNDSLLDLLVGEKLGMIKYFRNAGTKDSAFFFTAPTIDTVGGILVEACCDGHSVPFYTQNPDTLDTLGTPLLLVGSRGGIVVAYDSIGPFLTGNFHPVDTIATTSRRATVSGIDLSNDGQPEFVFGEIGGGVSFWTRSDIEVPPPDTSVGDTTSIAEIGENIARLRLFPNPANQALNVSFYLSSPDAYTVRVQDLLGKVLLDRTRSASAPGIRTEQFDLSNLTGGLYFVSIQAAGQTVTRKFVKTE
ncbi:MAG: T9SS type A sorting domain-containing protein, partial [Bacteroidota bacterium]